MLRGGRARAGLAASVAKLLLLTVKTPLFVPGYGIYVSMVVIKDFTHFSYEVSPRGAASGLRRCHFFW